MHSDIHKTPRRGRGFLWKTWGGLQFVYISGSITDSCPCLCSDSASCYPGRLASWLPSSIIQPTSLRRFYLAQSDTVTHYLWLEPEASAPCQGMVYSNRRQRADPTPLWPGQDHRCCIMWNHNKAANWGGCRGGCLLLSCSSLATLSSSLPPEWRWVCLKPHSRPSLCHTNVALKHLLGDVDAGTREEAQSIEPELKEEGGDWI